VTLSAAPAKGAGRSTSSESYGQIDNETALVTKAAVSPSTTLITAVAPTALADFINTLRGQSARRGNCCRVEKVGGAFAQGSGVLRGAVPCFHIT
jgi:hypothetical protein